MLVTSMLGAFKNRHSWVRLHLLTSHAGPINDIEFSPDGSTLASASDDRTIRLWDVESGSALMVMVGHGSPVMKAAFSADGTLLVTQALHGEVKAWSVATGEELFGSTQVNKRAALPTGPSCVVVSAGDGDILVYDTASKPNAVTEVRLVGAADAAALDLKLAARAEDGKSLLIYDGSNALQLWDLGSPAEEPLCLGIGLSKTAKEMRAGSIPEGIGGDARSVWCLSVMEEWISLRTSRFSSVNGNRTVGFRHRADLPPIIYSLRPRQELCVLGSYTVPLQDYEFSPAEAALATGGSDNTVWIWGLRRPETWWGVFWLWEFWLTVFFAALLLWSLYRDRKYFKSLAAKQPDPSPSGPPS